MFNEMYLGKRVLALDDLLTDKQLLNLAKKFDKDMNDVLEVISKNAFGLSLNEIDQETGLSVFVRSRIICAFEFVGLIEQKKIATAKLYRLTEQGKRLKMLKEKTI